MTAIDHPTISGWTTRPRYKLPSILRQMLAASRRRSRQARSYLDLQQLDERLLYDIGIDPLNLRASIEDRAVRSMLYDPMRKQFDYQER